MIYRALSMDALTELALLLRPAGGGLFLVSTGRAEQEAMQRRLYGASTSEEVATAWRATISRAAAAKVAIVGIPSDVGAGFRRGANLGPQALREGLLAADPEWPERAAAAGVVDVGDVFVVPQLLHDEMLSEAQKAATRRAIYPGLAAEASAGLPVSPLSIAERALALLLALNPGLKVVVLGGDHSTAWPVVAALHRARQGRWGVVQVDAHTDLLEERLGVKYCFATWSHHANELLGPGRFLQVGLRASRFPRSHWEAKTGVRQFWAEECRARPAEVLDEVVAWLGERGVGPVYFSNDVDGTDAADMSATGTPEPNGLDPEWVVELIRRLGRDVGLVGGDVMELAPPLGPTPADAARSTALAVRYLRELLACLV